MKFLYCVTPSDSRRNSRKHHKSSRRRRRSSRSSYLSPASSITKRRHSHQTDISSGNRMHNNNNYNNRSAAFYQPMNNDSNNALFDMNPMNYVEMGVPPTIFEHQVYSNHIQHHSTSQKPQYNVNQLMKMNAKVYPTNCGVYPSVMNANNATRGYAQYSAVDKKRRKRVRLFDDLDR